MQTFSSGGPSPKRRLIWGVIPARMESRRFPDKLLSPLLGYPLLWHTVSMAKQIASLSKIWVASDDEGILSLAEEWGVESRRTSPSCPNGTHRIAEMVASFPEEERPEIVVNIQGDEPCLNPAVVEQVIQCLLEHPEAGMATAASPIEDPTEWRNPSVVKCVLDQQGYAMYFSRSPIPSLHPKSGMPCPSSYRHAGLYVFRTPFLLNYVSLPETPLQLMEDLEQLKILEHGYRIPVTLIPPQPPGVDTPEDMEKVESFLCKKNSSLSQAGSALL